MWQGKKKALTFSFDDGVTQDKRAIEILNSYGLKSTFNLNSGLLGLPNKVNPGGKIVNHNKIKASEVKEVYSGHEIAVHTLTHPFLPGLDEETVVRQVEEDKKALEALCGYRIRGMAYPCGGENNDDRVAEIIGRETSIEYARTITSAHSFDLQKNLLRFNPSVYYIEDCLFDLAEKFLNSEADKPQLFYIWGHTYEMDSDLMSWEKFEKFCKLVSCRADVFYGTNREVLLDK